MNATTRGYAEFEFDLPDALLRNLVTILDRIPMAPLDSAHVSAVPEEQGVYQLFLDDVPVYVGKTDAEAGLNKRLSRHSRKILHRQGLDPQRVSFKAVRIYVFTAVNLESDLIRHYGGVGGLPWNGSGFGSNDPGRERDTTNNKPENYDYQYPIDIDLELPALAPALAGTAADFIAAIREHLPYTFRVQRSGTGRKLHPDIAGTTVLPPPGPLTTRRAIEFVTTALPPGWQATKLLGYVILYKETKVYPQSEVIARS